ncbi:MAG: hypothetical protein L0287_28595 [Anaerolineae bacterium]|nr:hypothetical protein [Anaerolineae bacterium]MCI0609024.1 hypothetical protein [Anaerolineae bacterium]
MQADRFFERSIPLLFLIVTIVAYGLLLPLTGFYWDDWPFAWIAKFLGPQEFFPAFAGVRPFLAPIFFVTTSLIPPVPIYWQIFALIIRFLSGLSAWFALNQIWPHHKRQVLIVSLLFLVFPGYSQHWVALTHINQEWIPFIFYLLSFSFTARALRKQHVTPALAPGASVARAGGRDASSRDLARSNLPFNGQSPIEQNAPFNRRLLRPIVARNDTIIALLLLIAGVFPTEYFIGLEPMRFLFIWVILSEHINGFRQRFLQTIKHWSPYLLIWLANTAWLAYFYTIGSYESYDVEVVTQPMTMSYFFSSIVEAIWKAGFYIWGQVIVLSTDAITAPTSLLTLTLILLSFFLLSFYFLKHSFTHSSASGFALQAILIGFIGILLGRIPSFAAGLPLTLQSSYDRFMISMMLGGSLFITGLIELIIKGVRIKTYLFALLIALGIGQQFFNANIFRRDWARQQEIYWQLAWRIPAMEPGTVLLTDQMPIDYETDLSFTAPINWMYAPDYTRSDLPYALLYVEKRLGGSLPSLETNTSIDLSFRTVSFKGSTSQTIVIYMPRNGCLRVLNPEWGDEITYSHQSHFLVNSIPLSNPSYISMNADEIAKLPFLSEPNHTWCYYYAKAELARQKGDWFQVNDLISEAISLGYQPEDPFEWLTYIEAKAMIGDIEAAEKLSADTFTQDKGIRDGLCQVWKRIQLQVNVGSEAETRVNQLLSDYRCAR